MWIDIELNVRDGRGEPGTEGLNVDKYEILDNGVLKLWIDQRVRHYSPGYWCTVEEDTLSPEDRQKLHAERASDAEERTLGSRNPYGGN